MAEPRTRTTADIRRELEAAEQRLEALLVRWRETATTRSVPQQGHTKEEFDHVEELLRHQRGTLDHLHQLWIEYAQANGYHAPQ